MERENQPPNRSTDSVVAVATSSTPLLAARPGLRARVVLKNTDTANPVYINFANGTATTSDFPLLHGESVEMHGDGAVTAIATGGSVNVAILEEWYSG